MNYGQNAASGLAAPAYGNSEPPNRPNTDLEVIHSGFAQGVHRAESIAARLAVVAAKLRGPFPPSAATQSKPEAVRDGMVEEFRQTVERLAAANEAAASLLDMIEGIV